MRKFLILFFILIGFTPCAVAGWFSDDDDRVKNCYNWYGEKEACYRPHNEKHESFVGFNYMDFNGEEEESLVGNTGFGMTYLTTSGLNAARFVFGGSLYMADGNVYVADTRYTGTLYSGEILLGLSLKAYRRATVRPMLDILGVAGFKSLEMSSPPTGVDNRTFGFSYGVKAAAGMEFGFWKSVAIRATVDYYDVRASKIAGSDAFPMTSLGASIGLTFFH